MVAAESKDAAVPPEGGPPPGERLRLPAGEEAGRGFFFRGPSAARGRLRSHAPGVLSRDSEASVQEVAPPSFLRPNGPPCLSPGQRPGSRGDRKESMRPEGPRYALALSRTEAAEDRLARSTPDSHRYRSPAV